MATFIVCVHIERKVVDARGQEWRGGYGLPFFKVEAVNREDAAFLAARIVRQRDNEVAHYQIEEISSGREIAPSGTKQACGAANACHLYRGHPGKHQDYKLNEW